GCLFMGIVGFMLIEDYSFIDAVYMSFITISTVGFGLLHPLSTLGKLFVILLITVNLSIVTYAITIVTSYFFDGEYQTRKKLFQMNQKILDLNKHCIVCGYGRNGQQAVEVLISHQIPFIVIEENELLIEELKEKKILYLKGDATQDRNLVDANIAHASSLITTLPDDAKNLFVVLTAREMSKAMHIVSRANTAAVIEELYINESSNFIGKTVRELNETYMINIIGLKDALGSYTINPPSSTILTSNISLIVLANKEVIYKMKR
ncbi:MAG: potassium channel protein, partial [Bacteroidetes bacterium]|nr:potassium channel protein [Bacteroidota bacterium]